MALTIARALARLHPARAAIAAALAFGAGAGTGIAQTGPWPQRAVTLVVAFAPGGMTDIVSRSLAKELSQEFNQPFVIENKARAAGQVGTEYVARRPNDGYTLLVGATGYVIAPVLQKKVNYDPLKDFEPVAILAKAPNMLVVHPGVPVRSVPDFLRWAKAQSSVPYATAGAGGSTHLAGELLRHEAGLPLTHVPYKGAAPGTSDTVAGQVPMAIQDSMSVSAFVASGSGLEMKDIDGILTSSLTSPWWVMRMAEYLGIRPRFSDSTMFGGSSSIADLKVAALAIAAGECDNVLVCYGSTPRSAPSSSKINQMRAELDPQPYEHPYKPFNPVSSYALAAARHMHEYGTTRRQLAEVAVAARQWARLNPDAFARGPALADLVSGQVHMVFDNIPSSTGLIQGGQIRPLAVASKQRLKLLPQVPTYAEAGLPAMNNASWFGLGAPAGTPTKILDTLNAAVRQALADPEVVAAIEKQGAIPSPMTRIEFARLVASQNELWKKVIQDIRFEKL